MGQMVCMLGLTFSDCGRGATNRLWLLTYLVLADLALGQTEISATTPVAGTSTIITSAISSTFSPSVSLSITNATAAATSSSSPYVSQTIANATTVAAAATSSSSSRRQIFDHMPSCDLGESAGPWAIGDTAAFCVFISTAKSQKMVFKVKVDDYSEMLLQDSSVVATVNQSAPIYTWVTSSSSQLALPLDCSSAQDMYDRGSSSTCPQVYVNSNMMAQILSLVVNMQGGTINSFAWDNSCAGCGPSSCMYSSSSFNLTDRTEGSDFFSEGTCGQGRDSCSSNSLACDLKVFLTWAGTDKNNQHLVSAGMRLSKLTGYALSSIYDMMGQGYNKVMSR